MSAVPVLLVEDDRSLRRLLCTGLAPHGYRVREAATGADALAAFGEERPDLDQIYQTTHALLTRRSGGWPLTMFLTPDGAPFFGGTYFPKEGRYGLPGFLELLPKIAQAYREQGTELAEQSRRLAEALATREPEPATAPPLAVARAAALAELKRTFDDRPIVEVRGPDPVALMAKLDTLPIVEKTSLFGTAVHAVLRGRDVSGEDVARALADASLAVSSVSAVAPSLEDVFLDVVDRVESRGAA